MTYKCVYGFLPHITFLTRFANRSATLIDNFLCNSYDNNTEYSTAIIISKISVHLPIIIDIQCNNNIYLQKDKSRYIEFCKFNEDSFIQFKNDLQSRNISNYLDKSNRGDPNGNYEMFIHIVQECNNIHFPTKRVKFKKNRFKGSPWMTTGIVRSITFRDKMYKRMLNLSTETNEYLNAKINLQTYNRILKRTIRQAKNNYYRAVFNDAKFNMKKTCS